MTDKAKRKRKKRIFRVVLTIVIIAAVVLIGLGILRRVLNKSAEGSPEIVMTTAVVQSFS